MDMIYIYIHVYVCAYEVKWSIEGGGGRGGEDRGTKQRKTHAHTQVRRAPPLHTHTHAHTQRKKANTQANRDSVKRTSSKHNALLCDTRVDGGGGQERTIRGRSKRVGVRLERGACVCVFFCFGEGVAVVDEGYG